MRFKVVCGALSLVALSFSATAEQIDPAQAIAHKFSQASEPAKVEAPAKPAAAAQPAKVVPVAKSADAPAARPDLDYEMDMLRRARVEDASRKSAADTPKAVDVKPAVDTQAAQTVVPAAKIEPVAPPPTLEVAKPTPAATAPVVTPPAAPPVTAPTTPAPSAAAVSGTRATVLLALDAPSPDAAKSVPDPIICLSEQCYVSGGLKKPATQMARAEALTLKGTGESSAETCRGMYGCVYRGVTIPADALITVIDLGNGPGGNTGAFSVSADTSCRNDDGELVCDNGLVTHGYRVWAVPEATAEAAGVQLIEDAVADGLMIENVARTTDK